MRILKILDETNYSVIIEALSVDESWYRNILVTTFDGEKRGINNTETMQGIQVTIGKR